MPPCARTASSVSSTPADMIVATEHIGEIAEILAAGVMRLQARKSSEFCGSHGESSLHFSAAESSHPTRSERENRT